MVSANSSTRAGGLASAATGMRPMRNGASQAMTRRSLRTRTRHRGPLDLDHDRGAVEQGGRVHLGDGGGGQAPVVDAGEDVVEGPTQVLLDHPADLVPGLGRHLVPQLAELGHQLGGEDALARGDDLAQLDVGGAQPLGRPAQPGREDRRGRAGGPVGGGSGGPTATPRWRTTSTTLGPGRQSRRGASARAATGGSSSAAPVPGAASSCARARPARGARRRTLRGADRAATAACRASRPVWCLGRPNPEVERRLGPGELVQPCGRGGRPGSGHRRRTRRSSR